MKEVQICVRQVKGRWCSRESGSCQSNYSQQTGSKKLRDLKLTYSSEQSSRCSVCIHLYFSPLICCVFFSNSASFSGHLSLTQTLEIEKRSSYKQMRPPLPRGKVWIVCILFSSSFACHDVESSVEQQSQELNCFYIVSEALKTTTSSQLNTYCKCS